MAAAQQSDDFITVVCATCHARLSARWDQAGRRVTCPDCGVKIIVPFPEAPSAPCRQPKKIGEYAVRDAAAVARHPDDVISVACPTCHARLTARWDQAGRKTKCPDCGVKIRIPFPQRPPPAVQPDPATIGQYDVGAVAATEHVETRYLDQQALIYAEPVPDPPRWTFFSGVFNFPWYRDSISRWLWLTIGLAMVGELSVGALALAGVGGQGVGGIAIVGVGFLVAPIAWMSIWTFSYVASCLLAVIQETAAGNDKIAWPDETWRERVFKLLYVGYVAVLAVLAGAGVGSLVQLQAGPFWLPLGATALVLFPIMLLSSLEANSIWAVASPVVLKSLLRLAWCWLMFFVLAGVLAAASGGLVWLGFRFRHPFLALLVAAPVFGAGVLIFARLLGRVGWKITELAEQREELAEAAS